MKKLIVVIGLFLFTWNAGAQTRVDSLDVYGREVFMPATQYKWDWGQATMLNAMVHLYYARPDAEKKVYLDYIKTAMDLTFNDANGMHPNAVASGHGMAFLAKITSDPRYLEKANKIYADYLATPRTKKGGVSHRSDTIEMWDDTIYMISMFLLEMYRYTGDEKYIRDLIEQLKVHREKLLDKKWGLWVHGYDEDNTDYNDLCSQVGWAKMTPQRKSIEFWGRGNGWVVMATADALRTVPPKSAYFKVFAKELREITRNLPELQDKNSGLWFQLPIYPNDPGNFIESSCTAMFAYGMAIGVDLKVLDQKTFLPVVEKAHAGLQKYATRQQGKYLIPTRVCEGTCIGEKPYYYGRKTKEGVNYAIGAYIMFELEYAKLQ
jgi:unsaturated rhamnogalacturonyl hydrolase